MKTKLTACILLLASVAFAQQSALLWVTNGAEIMITGFSANTVPMLTIPDTIDGLPVREIKAFSFQNTVSLTNLAIGANVTNIQRAAFKKCYNLTEVTFLGSNTFLEKGAFHNCSNLTKTVVVGSTNDVRRGKVLRQKQLVETDAQRNPVKVSGAVEKHSRQRPDLVDIQDGKPERKRPAGKAVDK